MLDSISGIANVSAGDQIADLRKQLAVQDQNFDMSIEQFLRMNMDSLQRSRNNEIAAEIRNVLSDALSGLNKSGNEVRSSDS